MKKPGGKYQQLPNSGNIIFGIRFPRNAKGAVHFDRDNGNFLYQNAILKELEALVSISLFKKPPSPLRKARAKGYQFAPFRILFDVKLDLKRKSRLVIGGHVVD